MLKKIENLENTVNKVKSRIAGLEKLKESNLVQLSDEADETDSEEEEDEEEEEEKPKPKPKAKANAKTKTKAAAPAKKTKKEVASPKVDINEEKADEMEKSLDMEMKP